MRPVNYLIVAFLALLPIISQAQNIDSIAAISFPEPVSALEISGDYAYVGGTNNLYVVNIANPANPSIIGNCPVAAGGGISIDGNYLISTSGESRVSIIDISNLNSPSEVGYFYIHTIHGRLLIIDDIWLRWPNIFAAATSGYPMSMWGLLSVWNIENVSQPESLSTINLPGGARSIFIADNYAYVTNWGDGIYFIGHADIYDISSPSNPTEVGEFSTYYNTPNGIYVNGNYAFVASDSLIFADVSDRSHPVVFYEFALWGLGGDIFELGDYLYVNTYHVYSSDTIGIQIINIADLSSPQLEAERQNNTRLQHIMVRGDEIFATADSSLIVFYYPSTGIDDYKNPIAEFSLDGNYPNPFNGSTAISYSISEKMPIKFSIFDIVGQCVATIDDGMQNPGRHKIIWDASSIPSGIYFARLNNGHQSQSIKMVLLK